MGFPANESSRSGKIILGKGSFAQGASKSAAFGTKGSLDDTAQEFYTIKRQRFSQINADGAATKNNITIQQHSTNLDIKAPHTLFEVPETTLNLEIKQNASDVATAFMKEEREPERGRRKQFDKESVNESSLHEQEEYEELKAELAVLKSKSTRLTKKIRRLADKCLRLEKENKTIKRLKRYMGQMQ
ncbi:uncharacterized protein LOC8279528 isoform X2 [Ricinus communis]|uniref:uncharacterized protein LOC8279528 isoform X2 n=1 Tax=Ricinus communis TaxID=3988 RepID=UPI00201B186B|nr:uncharacterized protein LOC8279528 isoform X2 [Ricinus communis]